VVENFTNFASISNRKLLALYITLLHRETFLVVPFVGRKYYRVVVQTTGELQGFFIVITTTS
jgi:hypothetical protein